MAEHLERAVGALGGLHARWWDHPRKAPLQWALPLEVVAGRAEAMLTWPAEAKRLVLG